MPRYIEAEHTPSTTKVGLVIALFVIIFVALLAIVSSATVVGAGEQGVVTRLGAIRPNTLDPGLHWTVPFIERTTKFSTREEKIEVSANSASRDLQSVETTIALNYQLDANNINHLYQEVGKDYNVRIIQPAVQESVKAATAQFSAEELITKRSQVKDRVKELLAKRLTTRYILVNDVAIVNFSFSPEFDKAIEAKQVAEQQALKAKRDLDRIRLEARQKVEQARAEAEALKLQKNQLTPELVRLREVEVQAKAIEKWDGKLPTYSGGVVPFLQLNK